VAKEGDSVRAGPRKQEHASPLGPGETAARLRLFVLFHEAQILGAGISVLRVVDELKRYGWSIHGWFPAPGPLLDEAAQGITALTHGSRPIASSISGFRRHPGPVQRVFQTAAYLQAVRRALLVARPHVVHANSLLMLPEATVAKALGLPVVLQLHELPLPGRKRDVALHWAARVADLLIGVSEPVTDLLRQRASHTPVTTIRNGVPLPDPVPAPPTPFTVGTVGYVSHTKGTDVFLEAARRTAVVRPRIRFEHVGPFGLFEEDEFERGVSDLAGSLALRDVVRMIGYARGVDALKRWRIFVLPSRREGFPITVLEAMAAGLPVIAADVGGVSEQIVHLESGVLVPPDDPEAIARWIVRLHDDSALRSALGDAAKNRVAERFTLVAQAAALHQAYMRVIRGSVDISGAPAAPAV
jgi:glycosyltransferase involved in cell wall biosynthesis